MFARQISFGIGSRGESKGNHIPLPLPLRPLRPLGEASCLRQRVEQDLGGMQGDAAGGVFDLVPATGAGCGKDGITRR